MIKEFIFCVGLPGCGKSTFLESNYDFVKAPFVQDGNYFGRFVYTDNKYKNKCMLISADNIKANLDGGGTFVGIANKVKKINKDAKLSIFVTHLVNNTGLDNLSINFDEVIISNSYKDWNLVENRHQNVKVFNVI